MKTGIVTVVEWGHTQQILTEQDFQLTGYTSAECVVAVGKLGNTYLFDSRIIDVQTGAIVETMTRDYRGKIDGLMREIESLAWDIVGKPRLGEINLTEEKPGRVKGPDKETKPKMKSKWLLSTTGVIILGGGAPALMMSGGGASLASDNPLPPELPLVQ